MHDANAPHQQQSEESSLFLAKEAPKIGAKIRKSWESGSFGMRKFGFFTSCTCLYSSFVVSWCRS
jgi:hypothetical protein